jgi:alpha-mannosidase
MHDNFKLFEKYPGYNFSFEGAIKYMLMKEYYPADFLKVKDYVRLGRWNVCGSSIDAGDVNIPSPEAIIRSILLGQDFYKKEFGKTSRDIFLPDCFGFGYALPSIASSCGLKGFSTQKLTWGSAYGIPFDIGAWQGVDGSKILAALNPGDYNGEIKNDLSNDKAWLATIDNTGKKSGQYVGYHYFGIGDRGGAPRDSSVYWLEKSISGNGPVKILSAPADLLCSQITTKQLDNFPVYNGELLMSTHGTGCYTSQCAMKRWNRKNELLADGAERASVLADWLGGSKYPIEKLDAAWTRFLWHQFHDDVTGTSVPEVYSFSWNDELLSLNQFSSILEDAAATVSRALDTRAKGIPVVVYNPISKEREDVVEAGLDFQQPVKAVKVFNKEGKEVPSQIIENNGKNVKILFIADVPSTGFEVYDVQPANKPSGFTDELKGSNQVLENAIYSISIDPKTGDIKRIVEKAGKRDLLVSPLHTAFFADTSTVYPAWEILYKTVASKPKGYLDKIVKTELLEKGPVRMTLKITREKEGSVFNEFIRLYSGKAAERIEFYNQVDWNTRGTLVKVDFPLAFSNSKATYDLGMGAIQRGNNTEKLYEVPAQQWADLTSSDGSYGVTIINDCKYGWDKPTNNSLRLTLFHTPETGGNFQNQATNDIGRHEFSYAIYGHKSDWRNGKSQWVAAGFNQPLLAFQAIAHDGKLGKSFSLASLNTSDVMVKAIKKAENSDEIIIRFQELLGARIGNVKLALPAQVVSAREVNGAEEPVGDARVENGNLIFDLEAYQPKSFAIKLANAPSKLNQKTSQPVKLDYNLDGVSSDANRSDGNIDGKGNSIPAELFPAEYTEDGISYKFGPSTDGDKNMLTCTGQTITLPEGNFNRVYVLAAATEDTKGKFKTGNIEKEISVPFYSGFIGQWENQASGEASINGVKLAGNTATPAYLKRGHVAYIATHRHKSNGTNEAYVFCYLFRFGFDLPKGAKTITLPDNKNIFIAAISLANDENASVKSAQPLSDELNRSGSVQINTEGSKYFVDSVKVSLIPAKESEKVFYTLDGNIPSKSSLVYSKPFFIKDNSLLKATTESNLESTDVSSASFYKIEFKEAIKEPSQLQKGLVYKYFEGEFPKLPDFSKLKPVSEGVSEKIGLQEKHRAEDYAMQWSGYVKIPAEGIYTFYLNSDDGSKLFVDDILAIDNDGNHAPMEIIGKMALKAGFHKIAVHFYQAKGGDALSLKFDGPGLEKQELTELFNIK